MSRNQTRIEGQYAIVSVMNGHTDSIDIQSHHSETRALLEAGATIEQLKGRWQGQDELSIRIHGPNSATIAAEIALEYDQKAFLVVSGGVATLWSITNAIGPGEALYAPTETYNSIIEDADATDNYSETMSGFRFRFV